MRNSTVWCRRLPGRGRVRRSAGIAIALAVIWIGSAAQAAGPFVELPGRHEFSGQMIARPWQPDVWRARGLSAGEAEARGRMARNALGSDILKYYPEVDEYIVRVGSGEDENRTAERLMATGLFEYVHPDWKCSYAETPNDPLFPNQWQHQNIESEVGWNYGVGNNSVLVAICDSGVSPTHPDINQVQGWNIPSNNTDTSDITGHGTFVAGMAAAIGDNAIGVVGAGWQLRIMPVRVENAPAPPLSQVTAGARWAADHGARIINCSYGGVTDATVQTTGAYCRSHNALLFWAAGNDGVQYFGSDHPDVVVVSATDNLDQLASFSNYGALIDVAAPGANVWSTTRPNGYGSGSGTSFSSPLAAGVAAVMLSINTGLTSSQLESLLEATCDDIGPVGNDVFFGAGRINLRNAMLGVSCAAPISLASGVAFSTLIPAGYYRFAQGSVYWSAVATRGAPGDDWDLRVYQNPTGGSGDVCFSGLLASSAALAGTTDFVIGDFNHNPLSTYYVYSYQYSGTQTGLTEWDDGPDRLTVNGPPVTRTLATDDLIEVWDVFLDGGTEYTLNFNRGAGAADTKALLFRNPAAATYWVGRQSRLLETTEPVAFTAPATDWYGVVVVNDNSSVGSYSLNIGHCTPAVALASGVSTTTNAPNGLYSFSQTAIFWSAVGVRGAPGSDWDVRVYGNDSGNDWPECFSNLLAGSGYPAGSVDFVVGDFNHNPTGTYYARSNLWVGTGNAVTEWDDGIDQIVVGQPPVQRNTGASDVLEIWDLLLSANVEYDLFFERSGTADTRVFMFQSQNGVYWAGRSSRVIETTNLHTVFTAPADDWYSVVVVNEDGGTGSYRVGVSMTTNAVSEGPGPGVPMITTLKPVAPNPAFGNVQIDFHLALPERVELAIVDVAGRVVSKLPSRSWEAGRWQERWDGRGRDGQRLPTGVYWVEMSAGAREVGRSKFILLR